MRKFISVLIVLALALGALPATAVFAAESGSTSGSFSVGSTAPSVSALQVYSDAGCTLTAAALTPQVPRAPSHVVPASGLAAWLAPDGTGPPAANLAPGLQVAVLEWLPTGWARVQASNGWTGWVDGRQLVAVSV